MIPYEKIIDMNSLDIKPEKYFFEESEFYSFLNKNLSQNQTMKQLNIFGKI